MKELQKRLNDLEAKFHSELKAMEAETAKTKPNSKERREMWDKEDMLKEKFQKEWNELVNKG